MLTQTDFSDAYARLATARTTLAEATDAHTYATNALNWAKWAALAAGEIAGKNEAEREANARMMLRPLYYDVEKAERALSATKLAADLAELHVQQLGRELRVWELQMWTGQVRADVDASFEPH